MNNHDTMRKYFRMCEDKQGLKPKTLINTKQVIEPFIDFISDKPITEDLIYDYLDTLKTKTFIRNGKTKGYSESSIYFIKSTLRKFIAYCDPSLKEALKPRMPERNEVGQLITGEEFEALLKACRSTRDKALVAVLFESGCRKNELRSLKISDVTFDSNGAVVTIPRGKTKPRPNRLIYSSSFLRQWIDAHPLHDDPNATLFCSQNSPFPPISSTGLHEQIKKITVRAGIKKSISPHTFRHTCASNLANHFTEQQMKNYLGWTKASSMAAVYVHMKDTNDAVLKMHGIVTDDIEKNSLKTGRCPRCKDLNPDTSLYCGKCGMPLKDDGMRQLETESDEFEITFSKLLADNPNLLKALDKYMKTE